MTFNELVFAIVTGNVVGIFLGVIKNQKRV